MVLRVRTWKALGLISFVNVHEDMLGDTARKVVSLPGLKNNKSLHFV